MLGNYIRILKELQKNIYLITKKLGKIDETLANLEEEIQKNIEYAVNKAIREKSKEALGVKKLINDQINKEYLIDSKKRHLLEVRRELEELKQELELKENSLRNRIAI